jgi:hypothetical protein
VELATCQGEGPEIVSKARGGGREKEWQGGLGDWCAFVFRNELRTVNRGRRERIKGKGGGG